MDVNDLGNHLLKARLRSGLTQGQLAKGSKLHQSIISAIENGRRLPTVPQLLQLARVLKVSLQWFLTGTNSAGDELRDISIQLQTLGIADLNVSNERLPGAFRRNEEAIALAVTGNAPPARIIEAIPAVLAWNDSLDPNLLRAFARAHRGVTHRLGWLADIATTLHEGQGFPGGCPALPGLQLYLRLVKLPTEDDTLGYSVSPQPRPPVSLRWKMNYPADLAVFRRRAEHLHALRTGSGSEKLEGQKS